MCEARWLIEVGKKWVRSEVRSFSEAASRRRVTMSGCDI